jgi:hypothetical protein
MNWINGDSQSQSIYILYGVAGIGKSTVAKTLAERAADANVLGASFFFSRDEDNRKTARRFFPTLADHLARYDETFAKHVNIALEKDPNIAGRDIRKQFDSLIATPLQFTIGRELPILIVIDALDECDKNGAKSILSGFAREIPKISRLKIFITTRPEQHIQSALNPYRDFEQFHMQDIERSVVEADIQLYLDFRLSKEEVQRALPNLLPPPWQPSENEMKILVGMSGKLFIIACTAADFILESIHADPAKQVAKLLDGVSPASFSGSKHATILDDVYMRIIRAAQPNAAWVHWFQTIVGAVILLQDPLPCESLAKLLNVDPNKIMGTLSSTLASCTRQRRLHVSHPSQVIPRLHMRP